MSAISLDTIRQTHKENLRKTKIFCTLGPACWSVEGLCALIDQGMNVARFNFSHGDHKAHGQCLERLREAISQRPGCNVAVLLDTKGPEIRTGFVDPSLNKLQLTKDEIIEVGTDYDKHCTQEYLACSYKSLPKSVKVGSMILVADGSLSLEVVEIKETSIMAKIMNNASLGDKKNMNLPGAIVDLPTLTEKDIDDLQNFGVPNNVDFIAASFVRKAADVDFIRKTLGENGKHIKIISKIENQEGLENFDEILKTTDGIMVARGDLGMEIPIEKVFLAQKMMIHKSNIAGIPVVTATQMLESMINAPRPTRAECADVANAVLDGTCAVMLSGETANGAYSKEAVSMMAHTCLEAESIIDYNVVSSNVRTQCIETMNTPESLAYSACSTAFDVGAKCIFVLTESGFTARMVAKYKPACPILVITAQEHVARQCTGYMKNCRAKSIASLEDASSVVSAALAEATSNGLLSVGDRCVAIYGAKDAAPGSINTIHVHVA
jgi:pyruvate kinase